MCRMMAQRSSLGHHSKLAHFSVSCSKFYNVKNLLTAYERSPRIISLCEAMTIKNAKVLTHDSYKFARETWKFLKVGQSLRAENTSYFIFLCWPQGQAAVGTAELPLQSCSTDCSKVFSMNCLVLVGGKKDPQKPQKKNPKQLTAHQYLSCAESSDFPKSTFFFPLWFVGGGEGLCGIYQTNYYKWNKDKAECFLLTSTQW